MPLAIGLPQNSSEGLIGDAHANIGRVVFMMPPVSQVDASHAQGYACIALSLFRMLNGKSRADEAQPAWIGSL